MTHPDPPLSAFVQEMQEALERKDYAALQHIMLAHLRPSTQQRQQAFRQAVKDRARDWQRSAAGEMEDEL